MNTRTRIIALPLALAAVIGLAGCSGSTPAEVVESVTSAPVEAEQTAEVEIVEGEAPADIQPLLDAYVEAAKALAPSATDITTEYMGGWADVSINIIVVKDTGLPTDELAGLIALTTIHPIPNVESWHFEGYDEFGGFYDMSEQAAEIGLPEDAVTGVGDIILTNEQILAL